MVTPAAISYNINGVEFVLDSTTASAITTGTSISIKITTYGDETVKVSSTTSSAITPSAVAVTTSSAIDGGLAHNAVVELDYGENIIYINIDGEEYILTVNRQDPTDEPK